MLMSEDTRYSYNEYVKMMYQKGYYVGPYYINLMSDEVYCIENRILIVPAYVEGEDKVYVFTGMSQKATTLSEPTEFKLYLEDTDGHEFRDGDNVMLSLVRPNDVVNLYTRNYATWKFGVMFDKGVHLDIINVDLFRHKKKVERKYDRMMWLE
jgi:hypothetical protein